MKPANKFGKCRALVLLGAVVAMAIAVACSSDSKPMAKAAQPSNGVHPAVLQTSAPVATPVAAARETAAPMRPSAETVAYRSRNYGVSFLYPWQYAFLSAKAVATGNESRRPRPDGHDGQFTLARIEIPKGYYPDTDFESGYFTLSLNQYISEQECQSALAAGANDASGTETINGVEFRWVETENGGHGSAAKVRNYVAFVNDTCYELEVGVKTVNEDGLAREVDPDQVFRRLETIVKTVKILPAAKGATTTEVASQN